jgi:hypothetical protein
MCLYLMQLLSCLGERLGGSALFRGEWGTDGCAACMLDMEHVRGVMRSEMMGDSGHNAGASSRIDCITSQ